MNSSDSPMRNPLHARHNDLEAFYVRGRAVELWDDRAQWKERAQVEIPQLDEVLKRFSASKILDVACAAGFHVTELSKLGYEMSASDGCAEFVLRAQANVSRLDQYVDIRQCLWADVGTCWRGSCFDAVLCLGASLHHTDATGVSELFRNARAVSRANGGVMVVDQRNYVRMFEKKIACSHHPGGWSYAMTYLDSGNIQFHLTDSRRGIDVVFHANIVSEDELIAAAHQAGYVLAETNYDYGKIGHKQDASWLQYVFVTDDCL